MPLTAYMPKDLERYSRHQESVLFSNSVVAGKYVYVQNCDGKVWVAPDGPHMHPRVLGSARAATAAGELVLERSGLVVDINNLSGTFQCKPDSLLAAVGGLIMQGARIAPEAVDAYEI
jgi:hypothetical protein